MTRFETTPISSLSTAHGNSVPGGLRWKAYTTLFGLALVMRLCLLFAGPWENPGIATTDDSARYVVLADNLLKFKTFGKHEEDGLVHESLARLRAVNGTLPPLDANGLRPESFRTPGYPAFLALFGGSAGLRIALLCQCILGAFLAPAVAALAGWFGLANRSAFIAGLIWAVHPGLVLFDCLILTESLFNVCVVLGSLAAARARSWRGSLLAGLGIGLAGLVRPLGLLYLPFAWLAGWRHGRHRILAAAILLLMAITPSGFWACRNRAVGEGMRVTTVGNVNLLFYTAAYAISEERGEDWLASWPTRVKELSQVLEKRLQPGEDVVSAMNKLAVEELLARPSVVARVHLKSGIKLFVDHSLGETFRLLGQPYHPSGLFSRLVLGNKQPNEGGDTAVLAIAAAWSGFNLLIVLAVLVGFVRALRNHLIRLALASVVTIGLFVLATSTVGIERTRLPLMPPLCLLAGCAFITRPATPTSEKQLC